MSNGELSSLEDESTCSMCAVVGTSSESLLPRVSALALGVVNDGPASSVLGDGSTDTVLLVNAVEGSEPISKGPSVLISGRTGVRLFGCSVSVSRQYPVPRSFLSILQLGNLIK